MTLHDELRDLVEHTPKWVDSVIVDVDCLRNQLEQAEGPEAGEGSAEGERYLTTSEAAQRLGVEPRTVADWCRKGRLPHAFKTGEEGDGEWRIPRADVDDGPADNQADDDGRERFHRKRERAS